MKTIGMIGGMSWESSLEYYRIVNEETKSRLGGFHSSSCLMESLDFAVIEKLQHQDRWDELTQIMVDSALNLEKAGADLVLICTNTMHLMAPQVEKALKVPLLHIADAAGEAVKEKGLGKVGLLGTLFTMEKDFYRVRIKEKYDIDVLIPEEEDRRFVHNIIYSELVKGDLKEDSRREFLRIINALKERGCRGVILGCTEIPLLIKQKDSPIPVFDTAEIHARAAVSLALS